MAFEKVRVVVCLVAWIALFSLYSHRINLGIAIIGMVDPKPPKVSNVSHCPSTNKFLVSEVDNLTRKYDWDESQQNYLLLAYNIGYLLAHIPGSLLSIHFGLRNVMLVCLLISTLMTLITPWLVFNFWVFFAARIFVGISNGSLYPIIHETIANHAPPNERTVYAMLTHTGNIISLVVVFPLGGYFLQTFIDGWKYIFIMTGLFGVVSFVLWLIFVYSEPDENPWMSEKEKKLIVSSIYPDGPPPKKKISNIPFHSILTSKHIYILSCVHFGKLFILYMNLFGLVKYLFTTYDLSRSMAGNLAVIPFLADFIFQLFYPKLVDIMKKSGMTITAIRKLNTFIGALGCSAFLIAAGFLPCDDIPLGVAILSLSLLFLAPFQAGYFTAIIEIAPQYSSIDMAIINVSGSLAGVVQRYITAALVSSIPNIRTAYCYSFIITGGICFLFSMVFVIFGTAERQPWARTGVNKEETKLNVIPQNEQSSIEKK